MGGAPSMAIVNMHLHKTQIKNKYGNKSDRDRRYSDDVLRHRKSCISFFHPRSMIELIQ